MKRVKGAKKSINLINILLVVVTSLLLVGICAFIGINFYIGTFIEYSLPIEELPQSPVVLVLGAPPNDDGSVTEILKRRLNSAIELYEAEVVPKILISGNSTATVDEVHTMNSYLQEKGVPTEDIIIDYAGFDTFDSVYRSTHIFHFDSIIISTQEYHMKRALYIARSEGILAYGYASENHSSFFEVYIRESFANIKAFIEVTFMDSTAKILSDALPV